MAYIYGTPGDDRADLGGTSLIGTGENDYIYGYAGNDLIEGRGGNDSLYGGSGNFNTIFGGQGNDLVHSEGIGGYFDGGAGVDRLALTHAGSLSIDLGAGWGNYGSSAISRFSARNFEHLVLSAGNDTVVGSAAANHVMTGAGNDVVQALGGADTVYGEAGNDTLDGGGGNDTVNGGLGDDEIFGGAGHDSLEGHDGHDLVWGGAGNDILSGGRGNDTLDGGESGFDTASYANHQGGVTADLRVGTALSTVFGVTETDTLFRIDKLIGSSFDDFLFAQGATEIEGGAGNDTIYSGAGTNRLTGGAQNDTVVYTFSTAGVNVDLAANTASGGWAQGDILSGFESVRGSDHGDTLRLGANGGTLEGRAGNDVLTGGGGSDRIIGGSGYDDMRGGAGPDFFVFTAVADSAWSNQADRIRDFTRGSDKIDLSALDANAHVSGNQAFTKLMMSPAPYSDSQFTAGTIAFNHASNSTLILVNTSDNSTNGFDAPELAIVLDGVMNLSLSDFIL